MINEVSNSKFISINTETNTIQMISKFNNQYIENEIIMLNYISQFGLPIPDILEYNSKTGAMTQKYFPNTTLFKVYSSPLPVKFSPIVFNKIQCIANILCENRIFIDDFQLIYNDEDVAVIDPGGVYHLTLSSKCFIFSVFKIPTRGSRKKK